MKKRRVTSLFYFFLAYLYLFYQVTNECYGMKENEDFLPENGTLKIAVTNLTIDGKDEANEWPYPEKQFKGTEKEEGLNIKEVFKKIKQESIKEKCFSCKKEIRNNVLRSLYGYQSSEIFPFDSSDPAYCSSCLYKELGICVACEEKTRECSIGKSRMEILFDGPQEPKKCFKCGAKEFFTNLFKSLPEKLPIIRGIVKIHKANKALENYYSSSPFEEKNEKLYDPLSYTRSKREEVYLRETNNLAEGIKEMFWDSIEYSVKAGCNLYDLLKK